MTPKERRDQPGSKLSFIALPDGADAGVAAIWGRQLPVNLVARAEAGFHHFGDLVFPPVFAESLGEGLPFFCIEAEG